MKPSEQLELIILPTERCNFRCWYCYEDFKLGRMNKVLILAIKKVIESHISNLRELQISWFGGEPLIALKEVLEISEFARNTCSDNDTIYSSSMSTNGFFLNVPTMEKLVTVGVSSFQITLDGHEKIHNTTRVRPNGRGTYKEIYQNLLNLKKSQLAFRIVLRLHYTLENHQQLIPWLNEIAEEFGSDSRFQFLPYNIGRYGGDNDKYITEVSLFDKNLIEDKLWSALGKDKLIEDDKYVCYASKLNSFVVRSDGTLAKCTLALNSDYNNIGHLDEQGLHIDSDKYFDWIQGLFTGDPDELRCPNMKFCNTC